MTHLYAHQTQAQCGIWLIAHWAVKIGRLGQKLVSANSRCVCQSFCYRECEEKIELALFDTLRIKVISVIHDVAVDQHVRCCFNDVQWRYEPFPW